ncbi:MAG: AsmA-like C-terminal region-containing protein, partial [Gammaproteobacteria bacterium]
KFDGTVSAMDNNLPDSAQPLRIEASGQLNGRAVTASVNAEPLATASREKPYRFEFIERSSGSRLTGHGSLPRPFDFQQVESTFEAEGADLKDLYFLTGLNAVHTGAYRLSGKLTRREDKFEYSDLVVTTGKSDLRGTVRIDTSSGRARVEADLESQVLRLSDLGAQASPGAAKPQAAKLTLLPDTKLDLTRMRRRDAVVNYRARSLEAGHVSLHAVSAKATIDRGIVVVSPMSAALPDGNVTGRVRIDVTNERPAVDADLKFSDLQLSRFRRKGSSESPFDGLLRGRVSISGHGSSVHEVAASATGTVTAVVPHGAVRASLAELTAFDLRGLGLTLARDKSDTPIRCAVVSFKAHDGTLTSENLVIDTEPVLIGGSGTIDLDSEALDLTFNGQPKSLRLGRVRTPVSLRGTLSKPSFGIQAGGRRSMVQTGGAVALGLVLTPLAAVLAFVDPGLAKDANCAALLAAPAK